MLCLKPDANHKSMREKAWKLVEKYIKSPNLKKHALAVEAVMKKFGQKFGGDTKIWSLAGLLHDLDWEMTQGSPQDHGKLASEILKKEGWPEEIVKAVKTHNHVLGIKPETLLEKTLYSVEELTGLITACALVNPKKLSGVKTSSVLKKMKEKSFARGVNREVILKGPKYLGLSLEEIIEMSLEAMKEIRDELGL